MAKLAVCPVICSVSINSLTIMTDGLPPAWTSTSMNKVLYTTTKKNNCLSQVGRENVSILFVLLQSREVFVLDFLPQIPQFIKIHHGENAAHDGQTIDVVLASIGSILEIVGNSIETIQNAALQGLNWSGLPDVSAVQVRLGNTVLINH